MSSALGFTGTTVKDVCVVRIFSNTLYPNLRLSRDTPMSAIAGTEKNVSICDRETITLSIEEKR
jgi:hypothetical protein